MNDRWGKYETKKKTLKCLQVVKEKDREKTRTLDMLGAGPLYSSGLDIYLI